MKPLEKRVAELEGMETTESKLPALWVVPRVGETEADAIAHARIQQTDVGPDNLQIIWRVKNAA